MAQDLNISAPSLKVYVNSSLFGIATDFKFSVDYGRRRINGIDVQESIEIASEKVTVKGSMEVLRLHGSGGLEGYGMLPQLADLALEKYCSLSVVDMATNVIIFKSDFCMFTRQDWRIKTKDIMHGSVAFEAIDYKNEISQ
ncbi:MAG: hypothetical protein KGO96_07770 [Elusimicrobia bacterium]|nr:hypothetical protein [Elusimicrobiota bacterium]